MARKKKTGLERLLSDEKRRTVPKFTKKDKAELDQMTRQVRGWNHTTMMATRYGQRMAKELLKRFPGDTSSWAESIAAMCVSFEKDRDCRKLLIEWFHERYAAHVMEARLDEIERMMGLLRSLRYTRTDPIEEGNDYSSWLESENVAVLEDQNTRLAIIIEREPFYKLHVRRLRYQYDSMSQRKYWGFPSIQAMRKCQWEPKYGDSRDDGYVLSYGSLIGKNEVPGAAFYWSRLEHFLFRVHTLHTVLESVQAQRLGEIHAAKDRE